MNAISINISKVKALSPSAGPVMWFLCHPMTFPHTQTAMAGQNLDSETKVCIELTGRYYEPVANWLSDADIFVSAINPILIRDFGNDSLLAPKTDKADSKKITRYTLDRWAKLKQHGSMDKTRNQLKTMNGGLVSI